MTTHEEYRAALQRMAEGALERRDWERREGIQPTTDTPESIRRYLERRADGITIVDEVLAALRALVDLIQCHGWVPPGQHPEFGWAIVEGIVHVVDELDRPSTVTVAHVIREHLGSDINVWEKQPGRTQEEVVAMLQAVAAGLEAK